MGKSKEINFVGQPVLKQIMEIATAIDIKGIIREKQSDRYYKSFGSMTHLVTMLFGILSRCGSMTEVCEGLRGMVHAHRTAAADRAAEKGTGEKGLFGSGYHGAHPPDQPAGRLSVAEKRKSGLQRKEWATGQRPIGDVLTHSRGRSVLIIDGNFPCTKMQQ